MNSKLLRHIIVGIIATVVVYLFWLSRPEWSAEMRLWRAFGDASFVFLAITLIIGPITKLRKSTYKILPWRRQFGIWFAILAIIHGFLIWDGWARWDILRLLGYEYVEQLGRYARLEPGFGLANLLGLVALFWAVVLAATSSDWMIKYLGGPAWKWLHYGANIIFYLSSLHVIYFMFLHYTASFHRSIPAPNWFRWYSVAIIALVLSVQVMAFVKEVRARRKSQEPKSVSQPTDDSKNTE